MSPLTSIVTAGRRHPIRTVILAMAVLVLAAAPALVGGSSDRTTDAAGLASGEHESGSDRSNDGSSGNDPVSAEEREAALDLVDDSYGHPDSGANVEEGPVATSTGDGPVDLGPVETVGQTCGQALASGASLIVSPAPAVLEPGDLADELTIRNCSEQSVNWAASTVPDVSLDTAAATLAGGESTELGFVIDHDAFEPGAIQFTIAITEPSFDHDIDVHAFRKAIGLDHVAGNGTLSAGPGAGGCANSCIRRAWLTSHPTHPNVDFEVATDSPATVEVWASTVTPLGNVAPMEMSSPDVTLWNTTLRPLQPDTEYHLLLRATDGSGNTDERRTTFRTSKPVAPVGEFHGVDPKCHAQCISQAKLSPGADFSVRHLEVRSRTPAFFQAWLSTDAPSYGDDGVPTFEDPDLVEVSGLAYDTRWDVDLTPLRGSTKYHIFVRAEDADGNVSHRAGSFTTASEPTVDVLVTFQRLRVTNDGDKGSNRGELSFVWDVGDTNVGSRGEERMSDGDGFTFPRSRSAYLATGLTERDHLPGIFVSGSERDADGRPDWCVLGSGAAARDSGKSAACDATWNVAALGFQTVASALDFPPCSELGVDDSPDGARCRVLTTPPRTDGYPQFEVTVSFTILPAT